MAGCPSGAGRNQACATRRNCRILFFLPPRAVLRSHYQEIQEASPWNYSGIISRRTAVCRTVIALERLFAFAYGIRRCRSTGGNREYVSARDLLQHQDALVRRRNRGSAAENAGGSER